MYRNIKAEVEAAEADIRKQFPKFSGDVLKAFDLSTLYMNIAALGIISAVVLAVSLAFQIVFAVGLEDLENYLGEARNILILNRLVISIAALLFISATFGKMKYRLPERLLTILVWAMPVFYLWVMVLFSISLTSLDLGLVPYLGMQFVIAALVRISFWRSVFIFFPPLAFFIFYEWLVDESALFIAVHLISSLVVCVISVALSQILFLSWKYQFHYIVLIKQQSSDLTEANEKLKRLADLDGLTGIANRRSFDEKLQYEWARARREKEQLALIMIDIDHFKKYNDSYGHQKGDDALKAVAQAIQSTLRRSIDFAARYGGEEFVVLLPMATLEGAGEMAEKIREAVWALNIEHNASAYGKVSISLGVACMGHESIADCESLLHAADMALYNAKSSGRNQVFVCGNGSTC